MIEGRHRTSEANGTRPTRTHRDHPVDLEDAHRSAEARLGGSSRCLARIKAVGGARSRGVGRRRRADHHHVAPQGSAQRAQGSPARRHAPPGRRRLHDAIAGSTESLGASSGHGAGDLRYSAADRPHRGHRRYARGRYQAGARRSRGVLRQRAGWSLPVSSLSWLRRSPTGDQRGPDVRPALSDWRRGKPDFGRDPAQAPGLAVPIRRGLARRETPSGSSAASSRSIRAESRRQSWADAPRSWCPGRFVGFYLSGRPTRRGEGGRQWPASRSLSA
jgi:hypothetical protein